MSKNKWQGFFFFFFLDFWYGKNSNTGGGVRLTKATPACACFTLRLHQPLLLSFPRNPLHQCFSPHMQKQVSCMRRNRDRSCRAGQFPSLSLHTRSPSLERSLQGEASALPRTPPFPLSLEETRFACLRPCGSDDSAGWDVEWKWGEFRCTSMKMACHYLWSWALIMSTRSWAVTLQKPAQYSAFWPHRKLECWY